MKSPMRKRGRAERVRPPSDNARNRILVRAVSAVCIALAVALCVYGYKTGLFTSVDAMRAFVAKYGAFGPVVFILIQIVQVVVPILPGGVSLLAGVMIFGPLYGFIYNYVGITIGSVAAFLLARRLGRPFVESRVSGGVFKKYAAWLEKGSRFDKLFALAIFLPVAPDDFLCMLAGITKMTPKKFVAIILVCKPPSILAYSLGLSAVTAWVTGLF